MPVLAREGLTASRLALLARRVQRVEDTIFLVLAHANTRVVIGKPSDDGPVTLLHTDVFSDLPHEIAIRVLGWTIAQSRRAARWNWASLRHSTRRCTRR